MRSRSLVVSSLRSISLAAIVFIPCAMMSVQCTAQVVNNGTPKRSTDMRALARGQGATLQVTVLVDDGKPLDRQSVVKLYSEARKTTMWQTTTDRSEVEFGDLSFGKYDIEVSVVGYLNASKEVEVVSLFDTLQVKLLLKRDASAIDFEQTDPLMSPRGRKEMKRAVEALKTADLAKAEKLLAATYKLAPSSAPLNFLFGYLFFQKRNLDQAQTYLEQATKLNPHYGQALILLGRVQLLLAKPDRARITLEQAVAADHDSWMAHHLLAEAYFDQHDYEKAREQAQIAVDLGRDAATAAQLVLGEALANLGKTQDAIQTWKTLIQVSPQSSAASQAHLFIAMVEQHDSQKSEPAPLPAGSSLAAMESPELYPADSKTLLPETWQPMGIDSAAPVVATGVTCPYEKVVTEAGDRVEELVNDVGKFAAVEELLHERLDKIGNPTSKETRKFDYAASISESSEPGVMQVDEYRTQRYGVEDLPDHIADNGFAALALVFHPALRGDFQMTCEGLSDWHGQAAWLVRFQQRDDRPNHIQGYVIGPRTYPVNLKGRAWITAGKFQIVRIESEMISPLPEIQLMAEHQITEYGPVPFATKNLELWLPKTAEVYLQFRGRRYYRRHTFEKYMLFSVDSDEKVREAKHNPRGPGSTSPRKRKRQLA
jgi:tetratricopeptide (TPR) repeat protein